MWPTHAAGPKQPGRRSGTTSLQLVIVIGVLVVGQACGGSVRHSPAADSGEAGSASSTPDPNQPSVATDDPTVTTTSPLSASPCNSPEWESCVELGTESAALSFLVAIDPDDHLLFAGGLRSSPSDTKQKAFIAKYTTELELIWFKQLGASMSDVQRLAVDARGNSIVVARPSYDKDSTIEMVAPSGATLWTRPWPGGIRSAVGLAVGGDDNVVLVGSDSSEMRVAKYSSAGEMLWRVNRPAEPREVANYAAADAQGNVFLGADRFLSNGSRWLSGALEKHGAEGDVQWTVSLDGSLIEGISCDASGGVFLLFNIPSASLVHLSADGDELWRRELEPFYSGYALSSDSDGGVWVTGFSAHPNVGTVAKYSAEGDTLLTKQFTVPNFFASLYVAATSDGRAFVIGPEDEEQSNVVIARVQP